MSEKNKENNKDNSNRIVIILLTLLIVLVVAFGGYILIFGKGESNAQNNATINNTSAETVTSADENTYSLAETIVNLADTDSPRYVKVKVSLGYDVKNSKLKSELESEKVNKEPILTDAINGILRSKKAADLTGKGIEDMKKEILDAVNPILNNGKISHIYFDELVVQ